MDLDAAVRTLAPRLIAYGMARTGSHVSAEDIAHDALLALVRRWRQAGPPLSPAAFAFAIAKRRASRVLARRALMVPIDFIRGPAARGPTVEHASMDRLALRDALMALRSLPRRDREALLLRAVGGLSYDEIALVCGSSAAATKMRVSRARRRLAESPKETSDGRRPTTA